MLRTWLFTRNKLPIYASAPSLYPLILNLIWIANSVLINNYTNNLLYSLTISLLQVFGNSNMKRMNLWNGYHLVSTRRLRRYSWALTWLIFLCIWTWNIGYVLISCKTVKQKHPQKKPNIWPDILVTCAKSLKIQVLQVSSIQSAFKNALSASQNSSGMVPQKEEDTSNL